MDNFNQQNFWICPNCRSQVPVNSAFCNFCGFRFQQQSQKNIKKKDSPISIVAGICGLLGFVLYGVFAIIGLVLGIIDLSIAQSKQFDGQKHACSWVAIIFGIIDIIYMCIVFLK